MIKRFFTFILSCLPYGKRIVHTRHTQTPISLQMWFLQKIIGFNRQAYWPLHFTSIVTGIENIYAGIETCPGYMPGCYIQGINKIYINDYTQISSNVAIISANHDLHDTRKHLKSEPVRIGKYCWIGTAVTILPEIKLGDFTIVGAGSVVSKSFPDGYCVIAGNPARLIRNLDPNECVKHQSKYEYNGYIPSQHFEEFRKRKLNV